MADQPVELSLELINHMKRLGWRYDEHMDWIKVDDDYSVARQGDATWTADMQSAPLGTPLPSGIQNQDSSAGRFWGRSVIYGKDGDHDTPYMTRYWIGRLRLHIFHRGDQDPDHHDHPWGFWTFPLTSYVEEVFDHPLHHDDVSTRPDLYEVRRQVVRAFRPHWRSHRHTHRVIGRWAGVNPPLTDDYTLMNEEALFHYYEKKLAKDGKIVTFVWREKARDRDWGFWKRRDQKLCWVHWKEYVFGKGKGAPCQ